MVGHLSHAWNKRPTAHERMLQDRALAKKLEEIKRGSNSHHGISRRDPASKRRSRIPGKAISRRHHGAIEDAEIRAHARRLSAACRKLKSPAIDTAGSNQHTSLWAKAEKENSTSKKIGRVRDSREDNTSSEIVSRDALVRDMGNRGSTLGRGRRHPPGLKCKAPPKTERSSVGVVWRRNDRAGEGWERRLPAESDEHITSRRAPRKKAEPARAPQVEYKMAEQARIRRTKDHNGMQKGHPAILSTVHRGQREKELATDDLRVQRQKHMVKSESASLLGNEFCDDTPNPGTFVSNDGGDGRDDDDSEGNFSELWGEYLKGAEGNGDNMAENDGDGPKELKGSSAINAVLPGLASRCSDMAHKGFGDRIARPEGYDEILAGHGDSQQRIECIPHEPDGCPTKASEKEGEEMYSMEFDSTTISAALPSAGFKRGVLQSKTTSEYKVCELEGGEDEDYGEDDFELET